MGEAVNEMADVETVRTVIDKSLLDKLEFAFKRGTHEDFIYTDQATKGLSLRVRRTKAVWVMKHQGTMKTIGEFLPEKSHTRITALSKVHELARQVKAIIEEDPAKVDPFLAAKYGDPTKTTREVLLSMRPKAGTWTLRECVDAMLEERQRPKAKKPLKPRAVEDYLTTFNRPEFAEVLKKPAVDVRRADIENVRRVVEKKYGVGPSIKVITNTRTVFDYSATYNVGLSGLEGVDPWWMMLKSPSKLEPRTRNPELEAIAKTMLLAEEYSTKPLPGRTDKKAGVRPGTLAAFMWIILTCQRADAATKLKSYSMIPDPERPGWYIATWEAKLMKGGKTHYLPVPPRAYAFLKPYLDAAKNKGKGDWAFPSEIGSGDKHVTRSGTLGVFKRLSATDHGVKLDGRPDTRVDLFAANGIPYWTQHDTRRRLVKIMDKAGMPAGASRIMAHDITRDSKVETSNMNPAQHEAFLKQMTAAITTQAYGDVMNMRIKGDAMEVWTDAVLDEYAKQKSHLQTGVIA